MGLLKLLYFYDHGGCDELGTSSSKVGMNSRLQSDELSVETVSAANTRFKMFFTADLTDFVSGFLKGLTSKHSVNYLGCQSLIC